MTLIQKTYCCRIDGANERKMKELDSLFSSSKEVSKWIFDNRIFFGEKDFYKATRESNRTFASKPTQKIIRRYSDVKDIFSLKSPIRSNLLFDNQMFDIEFSKDKYFNAFLRIVSSKKGHRMNVPLSGLWPIRKLKEAKKIDEVIIKKHSNGFFYAHVVASFECAESKINGKSVGLDLNHKGVISSDTQFYSIKELVHRKDEAQKGRSAKRNGAAFTKNFIHKITTQIIRDLRDKNVEVLHLEDLSSLTKNVIQKNKGESIKRKRKKLNRRASSFPYSMIRSQLSYKAIENGIRVTSSKEQTINTSIECSRCGSKETHRHTRTTFFCFSCGLIINADLNGARNIEKKGTELERVKALLNAETSDTPLQTPELSAEVPPS